MPGVTGRGGRAALPGGRGAAAPEVRRGGGDDEAGLGGLRCPSSLGGKRFSTGSRSTRGARPRPARCRPAAARRAALPCGSEPAAPLAPSRRGAAAGRAARPGRGAEGGGRQPVCPQPGPPGGSELAAVPGRSSAETGSYGPGGRGGLPPGGGEAFRLRFAKESFSRLPARLCEGGCCCAGIAVGGSWRRCGAAPQPWGRGLRVQCPPLPGLGGLRPA